MQILTETFGDVLVAHAPDELTDDPAHLLAAAVRKGLNAGRTKVVLQMDRSDSFDSAGLTALLDVQDEVRDAGGSIKVCGLTDAGLKVFEITRLARRFELFESLVDAVGSFR